MANELLEKPVVYEVNGEEIKLSGNMVKQFLVSGNEPVTDQEIVMFLKLAEHQKLNPFLKEVYLVKFKGKPAQNIVAKEAFMKRAENHPQYNGLKAGIIVLRGEDLLKLNGAVSLPTDKLIGGWANVYRKDRPEPVEVEIELKEFSKGQATWNQMPKNMIRKTAIVNALREAFPDTLGAMYTEDDKNPLIKTAEPIKQNNKATTALEQKFFDKPKQAEPVPQEPEMNIPDEIPEHPEVEQAQQEENAIPDFRRDEVISDVTNGDEFEGDYPF